MKALCIIITTALWSVMPLVANPYLAIIAKKRAAAVPVVLQGHAIENDGSANYFTSSADYSPLKTDPRSYELILRFNNSGVTGFDSRSIVDNFIPNGGGFQGFSIEHIATGGSYEGIRYLVANDTSADRFLVDPQNGIRIPYDTWFQFTITDSGAGNASGVKMYLNGTELKTQNVLTLTGDISAAGQKINVLKDNGGTGTAPWDGGLRSFRIYNKELSAAEVAEGFNDYARIDGSALSYAANLVHDYTPDADDSTTTITDKAGSNDLTGSGTWAAGTGIKVYDGYDPAGLTLDADVEADADWTVAGTATRAAGVGYMELSNSGAVGRDDVVYLPMWTRAERIYFKMDFTLASVPAAGDVIGFALSPNEGYNKIANYFIFDPVARTLMIETFNQLEIAAPPASRATSSPLSSASNGDAFTMMGWISQFTMRGIIINNDGNTMQEVEWSTTQTNTGSPPSWDHPFSTSQVAVLTGTGTTRITSLKYYVTDPVDAEYVVLSDSIGQGVAAATYDQTWVSKFRKDNEVRVVNLSGGGDRIQTAELTLGTGANNEMNFLNPQGKFLIPLGANNVSDIGGTLGAKYTSLFNAVKAHPTYTAGGAIAVLVAPSDNFAATSFHGFQTTEGDSVIDVYSGALNDGAGGLDAASDPGDGVHLNDTGFTIYASELATGLGL